MTLVAVVVCRLSMAIRPVRGAAHLKQAFNEAFWLPADGWYAVGLDRDKRRIDALTSNNGHCLWSGIADADKASVLADHLLSPEPFAGFSREEMAVPVPYPAACSPQAWAAAAPVEVLRALLRLTPQGPVLASDPALPNRLLRWLCATSPTGATGTTSRSTQGVGPSARAVIEPPMGAWSSHVGL